MKRRTLLRTLPAAAAGVISTRWNVHARPVGANDDVRIAVIGLRGRGKNHLQGYAALKGVRIVGLCDVDQQVLAGAAEKFPGAATFKDVRELLENKDIDAVSIATPNHWHALGAIWAMEAGKDVYVEKPVSHNVFEGRRMVEAAAKTGRLVQTGTQTRSSHAVREAIAWLQSGQLGAVKLGRVLCYNRRPSIGKASGPLTIPPEIDYDLWCGPAPLDPVQRLKLHYDWHWVWPTGNGDIGNQGVHQMDMVRWAMGLQTLSPRVFSLGGRLGYDDDGTTPNTQISLHDYTPAPILVEMRGLPARTGTEEPDEWKGRRGVSGVVECEGGSLVIPDYQTAIALDPDGKEMKTWEGTASHYENFIAALRTGRQEDLNGPILDGHLSAGLCHTGNISQRLAVEMPADAIRERLKAEPLTAEAFERMAQHLTANGIDPEAAKLSLGPVLEMDPATERFTGNETGNGMLTRSYRAPFVVS